MKQRVNHYIRPNESNRIPRIHVFIDVEWATVQTAWGGRNVFKLGCARLVSRESGRRPKDSTAIYDCPMDMWKAVSAFAGRRARTVVWAHNLGFDARIAEALPILPVLGWSLEAHNFTNRGTWFVWKRGQQTLCMVDAASVFSQPLGQIGKWFAIGKVAIPRDCEDMKRWEARVTRNVEILSTALLAYLRWLEDADMGNWQMTGAGQSWAHFRHRHLTHNMLVHTDKDALSAERRAMWTGRNEAYWHGELKHETVDEWDYHLAYATLARDNPIPIRLVGEMPPRYRWRDKLDDPRIGFLADVTVSCDTPVVPARHNGRIVWPTGTFETTLWDPEIRTALDAGAAITVHRGWLYRTEPAMAQWGDWIIQNMASPDSQVPAWQKDVIKNWARTVVGRPAMQFTGWETFGQPQSDSVDRWDYYDSRTGEHAELLQVGRKLWKSTGLTDWTQSMPMVTGYVMSLARVRLWSLISSMGPHTVLYADTDSILVRSIHHSRVRRVLQSPLGASLRLKRSFEGITIWGPRQIVTGKEIKISGVAHGSTRTAEREFSGQIHESLAHAMKSGNLRSVEVMDRVWKIRGVDNRRVTGQYGWTVAHHLDVDRGA